MKNLMGFLFVGIVFVLLFFPYLVWKTLESRINGLLSETTIVSRLAGMALHEIFREERVR
jgi:hypothetical protein